MTTRSEATTAARPLDRNVRRRGPGRVRVKLAALLQKNFPVSAGGLALTWEPEQLYPATGRYRTDWRMDCARWEGFARHYKPDGTFWTVLTVHSYTPMSELVKEGNLQITADGEVGKVTPNAEVTRLAGFSASPVSEANEG